MSVERLIGAVVTKNVVTGDVFLRLHDAQPQVVVVEQRLAAGVGGQRVQRLLLALKVALGRARGAAGIHTLTAWRPLGGIAQRSLRYQAARVDGIERHVAADGGIDGGAQLRLVVQAGLGHAAGEVHQGLLFGQRAEHAHRCFERGQLAVGIEDVEFGVVRRISGAGVFRAVIAGGAGDVGALADGQALDVLGQKVAVVGEVLEDLEVVGEGHNSHQVRGRHLVLHELQGGVPRPHLVLDGHSRQVEEHHQQAAVPVLDLAGLGGRDLGADDGFDHVGLQRFGRSGGGGIGFGRLLRRRGCRGCRIFQLLVFEDLDGLRLAVFRDGEIGRLQAFDRVAILILGRYVDDHQLGSSFKLEATLRGTLRGAILPGRILRRS